MSTRLGMVFCQGTPPDEKACKPPIVTRCGPDMVRNLEAKSRDTDLGVFGGRNFYCFGAFLAFSEGGSFIIVGHFGSFQRAVVLLFSAILAAFGGQYFYYFQTIWPFFGGRSFYSFQAFLAFSEGGSFIIFGHLSRSQRAICLSFSSILAIFGGRYFYYFRAFWPFSEGRIANYFLAFLCLFGGWWLYYFQAFWRFSEGSISIIFGHFGRFLRAVVLLFSATLAVFGGRKAGIQGQRGRGSAPFNPTGHDAVEKSSYGINYGDHGWNTPHHGWTLQKVLRIGRGGEGAETPRTKFSITILRVDNC